MRRPGLLEVWLSCAVLGRRLHHLRHYRGAWAIAIVCFGANEACEDDRPQPLVVICAPHSKHEFETWACHGESVSIMVPVLEIQFEKLSVRELKPVSDTTQNSHLLTLNGSLLSVLWREAIYERQQAD